MSVMHFTPEELKSANPKAVMARVEVKNARQYSGQRKHDLRIGPQPNYVDSSRTCLNRVIIEPPRPKALKDACNARREARGAKRAMKSNAGIAAVGIIGFGTEAQKIFEKLSPEAQDAAILEVAQALADEANTRLVGLVAHFDESSYHAHASFEGYDLDGRPLSETMKRGMLARFQDRAAEVMAVHAPGIERGRRRSERLKHGASYAETVHASVAELHERLPAEIAAAQTKLEALEGAIAKNQGYIDKLRAKSELNAKEAKRLATYEGRLRKAIEGHLEEKGRLEELRSTLNRESEALALKAAMLDKAEEELDRREAAVKASEAKVEAREVEVRRREGLLGNVYKAINERIGAIAERLGVGPWLEQILHVIDEYSASAPEEPTEEADGFDGP